MKRKISPRTIRHKKIRAKIAGTLSRPRLSVFKSNKHVYLQLIDDTKGKTLVGLSDVCLKTKKNKKNNLAFEVGKLLAKKAIELGIKSVIFDRGGHLYSGRVKKVADGARDGGLQF